MGCCLSTPATANKTRHRRLDDFKSRIQPGHATPSPPFENETVKEVLPETPTPRSLPIIQDTTAILQENDAGKKSIQEHQEDVTEMSEMCSCSESYSAATTMTVTNSKIDVVEIEDDGEVAQKIITNPPPLEVPRFRPAKVSGEISKEKDGGNRPPARRLASPSPMRKNRFPSNTLQTTQRHRNVGPSGVGRRDLPARRSRPPAIPGKCLNVREGSRAPAKNYGDQIRVKAADNGRKVKVVEVGVPPELETSESLDNPVVSMECFIFL